MIAKVTEIQFNHRATVWVYIDKHNNVFQSPQKEPQPDMIVRWRTGKNRGRVAIANITEAKRFNRPVYGDAHGLTLHTGHACRRGERIWVLGASPFRSDWLNVVSLDTQQIFCIKTSSVCFVPQLETIDLQGGLHYLTPVGRDWYYQWPAKHPAQVTRKKGVLPVEPTLGARKRKGLFRQGFGFRSTGRLLDPEAYCADNSPDDAFDDLKGHESAEYVKMMNGELGLDEVVAKPGGIPVRQVVRI